MKWTIFAGCLLIFTTTSAENNPPDIQWLGWAVTGFPWQIDEEMLHPKDMSQFQSLANKQVRLGLRSDGVVVWEQIQDPQPQTRSKESNVK